MTSSAVTPRAVEFPSPDGTILRGQAWDVGEDWALLVHGVGEDLDVWGGLSPLLVGAGVSVLSLDLRGHGVSDGEWEVNSATDDIRSALRYLKADGATKIAIVGAEIGATVALEVADPDAIVGCVALSPLRNTSNDDSMDVVSAATPALIIVGAGDEQRDEWATAVHEASSSWCSCMRIPVPEQGSELLRGEWSEDVLYSIVKHLEYVRWLGTE
jgi:pimeloyl-ACP methyl ester carboxylesterase